MIHWYPVDLDNTEVSFIPIFNAQNPPPYASRHLFKGEPEPVTRERNKSVISHLTSQSHVASAIFAPRYGSILISNASNFCCTEIWVYPCFYF